MDSSSKMPVPREFLPNPGDPVLPFKHWIRLFENFIFSKNSARKDEEKLTDEEKNRFLFTLLGFEGIRQPQTSAETSRGERLPATTRQIRDRRSRNQISWSHHLR